VNKRYVGVLIYVALVLSAVVLIANYLTAPRDVSWIGEVENWIKEENWELDKKYLPGMDWSFFLHENGTGQYLVQEFQSEFISNINSLMNRIDRQVEESISYEFLVEILAKDKVLVIVHRFPTMNPQMRSAPRLGWIRNYDAVYFILEDRLETGLEGTIIIRERYKEEPSFRYSVWQITDYALW
jgi:hypothetical protein